MKILEIAFHLAPGGLERFVVDLTNELAKHNDVTLMVLRDENINDGLGNFYKSEVSSLVSYQCLGFKNGLTPIMWWKIYTAIKKINPDVVHFHGEGMPFWMIIPILMSSHRIKFYQTIHNDIHHKYDKGFYKYFYIPLFVNNGRVKMIALSNSNYIDLMNVYPNAKATCIVNGRAPLQPTNKSIEVKEEFKQYRNTLDTKVYLHIGRCAIQKNQMRLINAFNKLVETRKDVQLLIIGDGFDNDIGKELKKNACQNIHFLGVKKNVSDYLFHSDFFCLSSDHEGMPITLIEALLCGIPALSTPVCGSVDAIKNGVNGYLSRDFSDYAYYEILSMAYDNSKHLKKESSNGVATCPYTIEICAKSYLKYFNI